ncbi:DUF4369 domain-containing protein [Phocaeicola sp.]|uniref:DUF4369 domain-containing protein n=1 Tax=Phocaeicola sp. TaxID=2773926 RepID=UPI0023C85C4D|nr:DUF4369 domain-containing protein [Phocaeicola sp.]MDE5677772.1 DUF4369 domain-containing protein [Phocaeicola sp.]
MNKLFFSVVALLAFTSCASEYKIEGSSSVSRLDGKMLFVKVPSGDRMLSVDSAEVVHGMFKMEGITDSISMASLYMDDESIMPFVIEKGKISIRIDNTRIIVSGTPLNDRLYSFVGKKTSLDDRAYELERKESRMIMDGKTQDEIRREMTKEREKLVTEMNSLAKEFIRQNYDNVLGPGVFIMLCSNFPYPVITPLIEEILTEAPDKFKDNPLVKDYVTTARSNMEKLKVPH